MPPSLAVLTHSAHQGSKAPGGVFVAGPAHGTSAVSEDGARAADGFADERLGVEPVGCDVDGPPDDALRVLSHRGEADLLGLMGDSRRRDLRLAHWHRASSRLLREEVPNEPVGTSCSHVLAAPGVERGAGQADCPGTGRRRVADLAGFRRRHP